MRQSEKDDVVTGEFVESGLGEDTVGERQQVRVELAQCRARVAAGSE